jgi:hypothetical protein
MARSNACLEDSNGGLSNTIRGTRFEEKKKRGRREGRGVEMGDEEITASSGVFKHR